MKLFRSQTEFQSSKEKQLWEAFKKGDEHAFSIIFRDHYDFLYDYGLKLSQDEALVKDSIQELFIAMWRNKANLGEAYSIRHYLGKSLRRKIIRKLKPESIRVGLDEAPGHESRSFAFHDTETENAGKNSGDQREQAVALLKTLPGKQQEVLFLRFYNELSFSEIADIMELNYQTVRNYAVLAIKNLRKKLDGNEHDFMNRENE